MPTWLYVLDILKKLDISEKEVLELINREPLELLSRIKDVLKDLGIKNVKHARVLNIFKNPLRVNEVLIEYIIRYRLGEASVKVMVSNNPKALLRMYYEYEA